MTTTTDHAAFLATIAADLAADAPRLVYADWLEENARDGERCKNCGGEGRVHSATSVECSRCHGSGIGSMNRGSKCVWCKGVGRKRQAKSAACPVCDGSGQVADPLRARSEFIRLQLELAELVVPREKLKLGPIYKDVSPGGPCVLYADFPRYEELRRRSQYLLDAHVKDWIDPEIHVGRVGAWTGYAAYVMRVIGSTDRSQDITFEFRRGFPAAITLDLGTLCGGERCQRCGGTGRISHASRIDTWSGPCPACSGTGRTPGIAAELGRACPTLEAVRVTGREAALLGGFIWLTERHIASADFPAAVLPEEIYRLPEISGMNGIHQRSHTFASPAAAQEALDAGGLRLIRGAR